MDWLGLGPFLDPVRWHADAPPPSPLGPAHPAPPPSFLSAFSSGKFNLQAARTLPHINVSKMDDNKDITILIRIKVIKK